AQHEAFCGHGTFLRSAGRSSTPTDATVVPQAGAATRFKFSLNQRARPVMRASSCCWPMSCKPTGIPPTLISGIVTTGANSIDDGALNTKSPVGRGAKGRPGTSPDQMGGGPGQERVMAVSANW